MTSKMSPRLFYLPLSAFILVKITSSSEISLNKGPSSFKNLTAAHVESSSGTIRSEPRKPLVRTVSTVPETKVISESELETWKMFEKTMKKTVDDLMKKALPMFLKMGSETNISAECSKSMMALVLGVRGLKNWAFRMLDSSAKIPSGILDGTFTDFGDFDECIAIEKLDKQKKVQFTGQYCVVEAKPFMPAPPRRVQLKTKVLDFSNFSKPDSVLSDLAANANVFYIIALRLGLCIPSACTVSDLQEISNFVLKDIPLKVNVKSCEVKEPFQVSGLQLACITIIGIFVLLAMVGTFVDVKTPKIFNSWNKICSGIVADSLKSFSIQKNLKNLLKISHSKENFGVLNGMRVFSVVWVILGHTYAMSHKQGYARLINTQDALNEVTFGTITNAWIVVDTFFVLGAFLVAYSNLRSLEKEDGRLNFARYYLHRIWRLIPALVGVLLIMFLLPLLGSGPLFKDVIGQQVKNCEKYWWQVIIIPINSWTNYDDMITSLCVSLRFKAQGEFSLSGYAKKSKFREYLSCLTFIDIIYNKPFIAVISYFMSMLNRISKCLLHTWYIASDMHFYLLAPVIFIPLHKWPVIGFLIMILLTVACMGVLAAVTVIHDFYPTILLYAPNDSFTKLMTNLTHLRPYPHGGAYCVGLALGYIVLRYRKVDMKPVYLVLGWCAAIACNVSVLYGSFEWNRGNLPSKVVDISYAMLHRTAWAMGIAWLMYMCVTGRGGIINRFLSWDLFTPLARLSYSVYIIHLPVLWMKNGLRRHLLLFHHYDMFYEFLATLTLTLCVSITFHLLFEAPFLNLEEVWFPKKGRKLKKSSESAVTKVTVTKIEN